MGPNLPIPPEVSRGPPAGTRVSYSLRDALPRAGPRGHRPATLSRHAPACCEDSLAVDHFRLQDSESLGSNPGPPATLGDDCARSTSISDEGLIPPRATEKCWTWLAQRGPPARRRKAWAGLNDRQGSETCCPARGSRRIGTRRRHAKHVSHVGPHELNQRADSGEAAHAVAGEVDHFKPLRGNKNGPPSSFLEVCGAQGAILVPVMIRRNVNSGPWNGVRQRQESLTFRLGEGQGTGGRHGKLKDRGSCRSGAGHEVQVQRGLTTTWKVSRAGMPV